ncbi:MAG: hypothetical protein AB8B63_22270, partial [Granulosicoccus sp.]
MNTYPMMLKSAKRLFVVLSATFLLSACSEDEGSVTVLDEGPALTVARPAVLENASSLVQASLRPSIIVEGGGLVSMQRDFEGVWSGTINVPPDKSYPVTVIWIETFASRDLPLARLTMDLEVAADGTAERSNVTEYITAELDADNDGVSNLQERENGTDPFVAEVIGDPEVPEVPEVP